MRRPSRNHVGCLVALALAAIVVGVFITGMWKARLAVTRVMCASNSKHISISALNYLDRYKSFPPGTMASALPVEQRFSWLTPILVGWSDHDVTKADPTRPWDDEKNRGVSGVAVKWYRCDAPREDPRPFTTYAGVTGVGDDSPTLPESHPRAGVFAHDRGARRESFRRGLSSTLLFVEYGREFVPWARGGEGTLTWFADPPHAGPGRPFGTPHRGSSFFTGKPRCGLVCFADASSRMFTDATSPGVLEAMATLAGGDVPPFPE